MVRTAACQAAYEGSIPFGTAKSIASEKVRLIRKCYVALIPSLLGDITNPYMPPYASGEAGSLSSY